MFVAFYPELHLQTGQNGEHMVEEGGHIDHTRHGVGHRAFEAAHGATAGHEYFAIVEVGQTTGKVKDDVRVGGEHKTDAGALLAGGGFVACGVRFGKGEAEAHDLATATRHEELCAVDEGRTDAHLEAIAIVTHFVGMTTAEGVVETPKFGAQLVLFGDVGHAGARGFALFEQGDGEAVRNGVVSAVGALRIPVAELISVGNEERKHLTLGVHTAMGFGHPTGTEAFAARGGIDNQTAHITCGKATTAEVEGQRQDLAGGHNLVTTLFSEREIALGGVATRKIEVEELGFVFGEGLCPQFARAQEDVVRSGGHGLRCICPEESGDYNSVWRDEAPRARGLLRD